MKSLQTAFDNIPGLETCAPPPLAAPPSEPPPPPPPPPPAYGAIRRIDERDIRDIAPWLLPRLNARYPHVNTRSYGSWLASFSAMTESCLVRNAAAAGLAQIVYEPCNPVPKCKVVWVYVKDNQAHAGTALYCHFKQWAKLHKCDQMTWDTRLGLSTDAAISDVGTELLKKLFPDVVTVQQRVLNV